MHIVLSRYDDDSKEYAWIVPTDYVLQTGSNPVVEQRYCAQCV